MKKMQRANENMHTKRQTAPNDNLEHEKIITCCKKTQNQYSNRPTLLIAPKGQRVGCSGDIACPMPNHAHPLLGNSSKKLAFPHPPYHNWNAFWL